MTYGNALKCLSDPTRRQIFERLRAGPLSVAALAGGLPVSRPAVSQHLRALKSARLVRDQSLGTRRLYQIDPGGLGDLRQWLAQFPGGGP
jgi:DNA-binding transcriptional ArsR family regulator